MQAGRAQEGVDEDKLHGGMVQLRDDSMDKGEEDMGMVDMRMVGLAWDATMPKPCYRPLD